MRLIYLLPLDFRKESAMKITHQLPLLFLILLSFSFKSIKLNNRQISGADSGISVIVNSTNSTNELTKKQLKALLKGEVVRWPDKKKVILAMMKSNTTIGQQTAEVILNMSANDMDQFYLSLVFQGKLTAPKTFESSDELQAFVANNPGAIGVINEGQLKEAVKNIKIDGQNTVKH
jgi:ABC-type phosphate transport system substrate-binding protein